MATFKEQGISPFVILSNPHINAIFIALTVANFAIWG